MVVERKRRRRFGVSLDASLADRLDSIASALRVDRSSLVERAVRNLVDDYRHFLESHDCWGLLVLLNTEGMRGTVYSLIEKYRDIVVSASHVHGGEGCVEVLAVKGPSDRIRELHEELERTGCSIRFIPLHR